MATLADIVIKPTDSEVDKLVNTLLAEDVKRIESEQVA